MHPCLRTRDKIIKTFETQQLAMSIARSTMARVYECMPWMIKFITYEGRSPSAGVDPTCQVLMRMRVEKCLVGGRHLPQNRNGILEMSMSGMVLFVEFWACVSMF